MTLVLLLGGLPGAGKSSIATALEEQVSPTLPLSRVEYDGLEDSLLDTIDPIKKDEGDKRSDGTLTLERRLEAWRRSRKVALAHLAELLQTRESSSPIKTTESAHDKTSQFGDIERIILMDDNYYLRSMRKQVHMTCQQFLGRTSAEGTSEVAEKDAPKRRVAMVSAWLDTPVKQCVTRNEERELNRRVPVEVIERMARQMEPPDASVDKNNGSGDPSSSEPPKERQYHWEQVVWRLDGTESVASNVTKLTDCLRNNRDWLSQCIIPPPVDPQVELERLAMERQRTRESMRHQIDQTLRKAVKLVAADIHKKYARAANEARKQVLTAVGDGHVETCTDAMRRFHIILLTTGGLNAEEQEKLQKALIQENIQYI